MIDEEEKGPSQSTPDHASAGTTDTSMGVDPLALPPGIDQGEETVAPGLVRLGRPEGTSKDIPFEHHPHPSYWLLFAVTVSSLALDLGTKWWASHKLDKWEGKNILTFKRLTIRFFLQHNPGGAWGLLHSAHENVRRPFFLMVSAAAIVFIVTLYRRLLPTQRALKWGLPLVFGGALGNVYDRVLSGEVVDFIDVYTMKDGVRAYTWPTFNVADIAICVGVGLMAVDMFTSKRPAPPTNSASLGAAGLGAGAASIPSDGTEPVAPEREAPVHLNEVDDAASLDTENKAKENGGGTGEVKPGEVST